MSLNTRNPYMFRSFLLTILRGAICRALCRYYNAFRRFAFVEYLLRYVAVCVYHLFVYVCVLGALVSERSVCELFRNYEITKQFTNRSSTDKSTKHTHK